MSIGNATTASSSCGSRSIPSADSRESPSPSTTTICRWRRPWSRVRLHHLRPVRLLADTGRLLSRRVRARARGRVGPSLGARRGNALTAPTKSAPSPGAVAGLIMSVIPGRAPASNPSRVIAGAGGVSNAVHAVGESAGGVTGWSQARHRSRCVRSYLNRSRGRRARRSPGCTPVRSSARRGRSSTRRGAQLLPGSTVEAGPGAVRAGRGSRPRSVKHSQPPRQRRQSAEAAPGVVR